MNKLSGGRIDSFVEKGFLKFPDVVPANICDEIREILWKDTGADPRDRSTWTKPVIRLGYYEQEPFRIAVNMPVLHEAFDALVGKNNWDPRPNLGSFPVRFPGAGDSGDTGWHVDSSFPGPDPNDFSTWRINVHSRGRALLMLFLCSDVGIKDAPTRILAGSHKAVAKILAPYGTEGLAFLELASKFDQLPELPEELATGGAGTVYLCHPFIVHAAQQNQGEHPKFMAQPPLGLKQPFDLNRGPGECYPVERAILEALQS